MAPRLTTTAANQLRPPSTGSRATARRMPRRPGKTGSDGLGASRCGRAPTLRPCSRSRTRAPRASNVPSPSGRPTMVATTSRATRGRPMAAVTGAQMCQGERHVISGLRRCRRRVWLPGCPGRPRTRCPGRGGAGDRPRARPSPHQPDCGAAGLGSRRPTGWLPSPPGEPSHVGWASGPPALRGSHHCAKRCLA
jgi:hypothetical protein